MKNSIFKLLLTVVGLLLLSVIINAQEEGAEEIDASKPTNFYSFLDNTLEYSSRPNGNVFGYRGNLTLAPSEAHLVLAEIPLLYNDKTEKFGIGDIRARYFWLPYKNYEKLVGAFGPSIDVFAPTGNFKNGIGSGRWIVSPGVTVGLMFADWIQVFPIVSYQYISKDVSGEVPDENNTEQHGVTLQAIVPIVFNEKFFVQLTPIYRMNNITEEKTDRYVQEFFAAYSLNQLLQLTGFFSGNFQDEIYVGRLGLTVYF